jgi:DeoR family glycerol-3-phosphate regulon repressor
MTDETALGELTARQADIVKMVDEKGFATLESLALHFEVSTQSIRRDIIQLDRLNLLQRFHGGAGPSDTKVRLGYVEKRIRATEAKARIGKAAAALVPKGATVFLDVGTTVEALAQELRAERSPVRVFTPSLATGMILAGAPDIELHVFAGTVRGADGSLAGATTVAGVSAIRFDIAFIGFSGFDEDGTVMDYDLEKIAVKQAAIRRAEQAIILGDRSKFERPAIAQIAPLCEVSKLVSDAPPPKRLADRLAAARLEIIIA